MLEEDDESRLSLAEKELRRRFSKEEGDRTQRLPSDTEAARGSERVDQLVLPDEKRARMPFTKDKYLVRENPHLVQWERETRKFLRNLSPEHGHRISASMVYEWATGIKLVEIMEKEKALKDRPSPSSPTWRTDMRKINQCLRFYFGKPYMTYIMGRKVPKAYRVKPGYYIRRHRPMTLTLYSEYVEGSLYP